VAEFGWQGPPTWSTLRRSVSDDPLTPESPGQLGHQKAMEGNRKLTAGLVPHLRVPDDMDDWHWAMSLNQARAIQLGVEHFRSLSPLCSGSIVWQLNDCWPVTSWAAVDGDGRRKPLFYALRHAHADRLITVQPRADRLAVVLVNDSAEPWSGPLQLSRTNFEGKVIVGKQFSAEVAARSTRALELPQEISSPDDAGTELVVAELGASRAFWFFAEDRDSALPTAPLPASARRTPTGYQVDVIADTIVRDLALLVDKVDPEAVVDDMLITLLPGETASLLVSSRSEFNPRALLAPNVLRTANQLMFR
jgi:beta-mannosidase